MGFETRANQIMELLRKSGTVQAPQLCALLQVSAVTIRKDLQRMEEEGLLHRTHGGAVLCDTSDAPDMRMIAMERIARRAAEEIQEGDCVILNAGNTTLLTARKLRNRKSITIITNSVAIARELVNQAGIQLIFLGGEVNADAVFTYGYDAVTQLEQYKAIFDGRAMADIKALAGALDALSRTLGAVHKAYQKARCDSCQEALNALNKIL